jgi:hypothetical protein
MTDLKLGPYYYCDKPYNDSNKRYYWDEAIGYIYFKNEIQKAIWVQEILGQISDGEWENSINDWEFWYRLVPVINNTLGWRATRRPQEGDEWPRNYSRLDLGSMKQIGIDIDPNYTDEQFYTDLNEISISVMTNLKPC